MLNREVHRIQNSPAAYGLLAGLLVLLLGLVANASCAHYPPPGTAPAPQHTAVEIHTECGYGSGVLLDGKRVLTAFHVINCADAPAVQVAQIVVVRTQHKTAHIAVRATFDPSRDLALLYLDPSAPEVPPVKIRPAVVGEVICATPAAPERGVKCGRVSDLGGPLETGDVRVANANYWYGNSGAGVYGADGALVGVVTRLAWCTAGDALLHALNRMRPGRTCDGRVSSIVGPVVS